MGGRGRDRLKLQDQGRCEGGGRRVRVQWRGEEKRRSLSRGRAAY